jgi:hypothetical protein
MEEKIVHLLLDPNCPNNILVVYVTGSGKSHVIRLVREDGSTPVYKKDDVWIGINLYDSERTRQRTVALCE